MISIGQFNTLKVIQKQASGIFLDGEQYGKLFVSAHTLATNVEEGDSITVFLYQANDAEIVATTDKPLAQVGDIAWLKVIAVTAVGAFMDWGLPKDLLVPHSEQRYPLELGHYYLVKVLYDPIKGVAASTFIDDYLGYEAEALRESEKVALVIADTTELGIKAVVNNRFWGLLYKNEVFQTLRKGQKMTGFVKRIREDDGRIDLSLYPVGYSKVAPITDQIVIKLRQNNNFLPLSDKSSPESIYMQFGVSKKVFKQAIGALYKQRIIDIEAQGIRLLLL